MPFLDNIHVTQTPENIDAGLWTLTQPLRYQGNVDLFTVPPGFETNYASVPRAFWFIVSPTGRHSLPAVLHDYLYCAGLTTRADADGLFRRTMREAGVSYAVRWSMYYAVRTFGKKYWGETASRRSRAQKIRNMRNYFDR